MSKQEPMTAWQQCRAIAAAAMLPEDHEQNVQRAQAALLAQLAAFGEKGAKLAERLAEANGGPIEVAPEDWPDELSKLASNESQSSEPRPKYPDAPAPRLLGRAF